MLLVGVMACSCNKPPPPSEGKVGTIDIHAFLVSEIAKCGGIDKTQSLSSERSGLAYRYYQDKDGFQVFCEGDCAGAIAAMLERSYGPPKRAGTNAVGRYSFSYSIDQVGVAINCGVDRREESGKEKKVTHLVVVKAGRL